MKDNYKTFCTEVPVNDPEKMKEFQKMMEAVYEAQDKEVKKISEEFGIFEPAAADIYYLRTRRRWTQKKEEYLIKLGREGKRVPNIFDDFEVPEQD